jgi:hypothetical protein
MDLMQDDSVTPLAVSSGAMTAVAFSILHFRLHHITTSSSSSSARA